MFEQVNRAGDVRLEIDPGIFDGGAHAGARGEIDDGGERRAGKHRRDLIAARNACAKQISDSQNRRDFASLKRRSTLKLS